MDKMKQWVALTALGALVILAAGWFLVVSPKRAEATALQAQASTQVTANAQLEAQLAVLRAQAKDLPKKQAALAKVAAKIPSNPSLPSLIRSLTAASTSAGVDFVSVTPGVPAASAPVAPAVPVSPPVAGAAAPAAGSAARVAAAPTAAGQLLAIPIAINVVGDYFEVEQFVANLENLPRALRVTNLSLVPGTGPAAADKSAAADDGRSLTSTITGSVFMAAGAAPTTAVVAPAAAPAK